MAKENDANSPVTLKECDRRHEGLDKCIRNKMSKLTAIVAVWTTVGVLAMAAVIGVAWAANNRVATVKETVTRVETQVEERERARKQRDQAMTEWLNKLERKLDNALERK